jgi:hypothetical protein
MNIPEHRGAGFILEGRTCIVRTDCNAAAGEEHTL